MAVSIKVEHINPFILATIETFKTMMKLEVKPGKVTLERRTGFQSDLSGIIGLSGGAKGSVSMTFPKITALKVVSAFIGEKVVTMDDGVVDAIGELANIVAGAAKKDLVKYNISISLPTVVVGDNHELSGAKEVTPMYVPFETPLGNFNLVVSFKSEIA
ncbi:MAG TPA: chemotaxis protein CheX [Fibrobacteria bacterium]|nr:chemotaxis protein CheX [Fibrobacteria bacterium]